MVSLDLERWQGAVLRDHNWDLYYTLSIQNALETL